MEKKSLFEKRYPGEKPLKIRDAPLVRDDEGNLVLDEKGKPIKKIWTIKEGVGIGTEGGTPEQGWTTPVVKLSLGDKTAGRVPGRKRKVRKTKKRTVKKRKSLKRR